MYGTIIEIEAYSDYDMRYTDCIMVTEEQFDVKGLVRSYCSLRGLPNETLSGLPDNMLNDTKEDFKKWLKKQGFRILSTKKVCISD